MLFIEKGLRSHKLGSDGADPADCIYLGIRNYYDLWIIGKAVLEILIKQYL